MNIELGLPRVAVIGGGIVGLATAYALQQRPGGCQIFVIEKEKELGVHQTGHNSGVIHSGIYYAPGSMKALLAVEGARRMIRFCADHGIPYELCGKVVVATSDEEVSRLNKLFERGQANDVPGLKLLGAEELREIEPHTSGIAAMHVPGTGIVNFQKVAAAYAERIVDRGGELRLKTCFRSAQRSDGRWILETDSGELQADFLINCTGLFCDRVARASHFVPSVQIVPFRGEYYRLRPEAEHLVRGLIYPVPDPAFPFLGVHFTRMIDGGVEAGPNAVLAFKREGYAKTDWNFRDAADVFLFPGMWKLMKKHWQTGLGEYWRSISKPAFVRALQRLIPSLRESDLAPGGAGVRAQALDSQGNLISDFRIDVAECALHVLNAPSPAATASLAIGETVARLAEDQLRRFK